MKKEIKMDVNKNALAEWMLEWDEAQSKADALRLKIQEAVLILG